MRSGKENIGKEKSGKEKSGKENIRKRDRLSFPHQERPRSGPPRPRGACLLCAGNRKGPVGGRWVFVALGKDGLVLAAQVEAVEIQASHERPGKKP